MRKYKTGVAITRTPNAIEARLSSCLRTARRSPERFAARRSGMEARRVATAPMTTRRPRQHRMMVPTSLLVPYEPMLYMTTMIVMINAGGTRRSRNRERPVWRPGFVSAGEGTRGWGGVGGVSGTDGRGGVLDKLMGIVSCVWRPWGPVLAEVGLDDPPAAGHDL